VREPRLALVQELDGERVRAGHGRRVGDVVPPRRVVRHVAGEVRVQVPLLRVWGLRFRV
jgi:hypothetical protein